MDQSEINVFDVYFASIVSMAHCHPGAGALRSDMQYNSRPKKLTLEECADLALKMIQVRRKVLAQ